MAKYSDEQAYGRKPNITLGDSWLINDLETGKRTKTVYFEDVFALFLQQLEENGEGFAQDNKFRFEKTSIVIGGPDIDLTDPVIYEAQVISQLDNNFDEIDLTIEDTQLIVFKVNVTEYGTFKTHIRKYVCDMLGKGEYNPIGNFIQAGNLELIYKDNSTIIATPEIIENSPNNVIFDLGDISGEDYLEYINEVPNVEIPDGYDLSNSDKIYYYRFTDNGIVYMYFFDAANSLNGYGFYGADGEFLFQDGELVLFYDSEMSNEPIIIPQNNKNLFVQVITDLDDGSLGSVIFKINTSPNFVVSEIQNLYFEHFGIKTINGSVIAYKEIYASRNIGKGNYGLGGTVINSQQLRLIYSSGTTGADIESNPENEVIIIPTLGAQSIADYITELNPAITILNTNQTLFKITDTQINYLFSGPAGIYGDGNSEALPEYFVEINTTTQPIVNVSQLINDAGYLTADSFRDKKIYVNDISEIANKVLLSDYLYVIQNQIIPNASQKIYVPATGLNLDSYGANISIIYSNSANQVIFASPEGGSGDLNLGRLAIMATGTNSKVFDLVDVDGTHEVAFDRLNFIACKSLGKIRNYRQGTGNFLGLYSCLDGLQFSGSWNGFKVTETNIMSFASTGTVFKKDTDTTFANRFFIAINVDFPTGAKLIDFISDNFLANELLQINGSQIKVNGIINKELGAATIPNLTANDLKCKWTGNGGLPDSAIQDFVEDNDVSEYYNIDWLKDTYLLEMTGDTTFTESSLPASGKNTQEINIALRGNFVPTWPANWTNNLVGTYKGSDLNNITVKFMKTGVYLMKIDNSLTVYPAPFLESLVPTSLLPSNTAQLTINGSFFTPATIVSIENQTVNSVEFVNQGQLILSVTTSSVEEEVDITISNGTTVIFSGILPINLGVVFIPNEASWDLISGNLNTSESGKAKLTTYGTFSDSKWQQEIDYTKDFIVQWTAKASPLGVPFAEYQEYQLSLKKQSDNTQIFGFGPKSETGILLIYTITPTDGFVQNYFIYGEPQIDDFWQNGNTVFQLRHISGILYFYINNVINRTFTYSITENAYLQVHLKSFDIINIKYIELP